MVETPYPWEGPTDDVIVDSTDELDENGTATMVCSGERTNYVRAGPHGFHIDEPESMDHSFKKDVGGRHEAPTALNYLQAAAMGCQVNSLELLLEKSRVEGYEIEASCTAFSARKDDIRRVQRLEIDIDLSVPAEFEPRAQRCLELYEKGCMVGEAIKRGIDISTTKTLSTVGGDDGGPGERDHLDSASVEETSISPDG